MTGGNPPEIHPDDRADPFFAARLTPHRSLGPRGFVALMAATGLICFASGLVFLAIGAWPVIWFFGLDLLIVYVAFRLNYDQARAYEEVQVSPIDVALTRVGRGAIGRSSTSIPPGPGSTWCGSTARASWRSGSCRTGGR